MTVNNIQSLLLIVIVAVHMNTRAESEIPWDSSKPIKIGSGVDLRYFGEALNECLQYDLEFETNGAVSTQSSIKIVDNYEKLVSELKYGVNTEISSKAAWRSYKANGTVKSIKDFEKYKTSEYKTLNILLHIESDYGKHLAKNYQLKPNFQSMLDKGDYSTFLKSCGTHIVIGERRQSQVALVLTITDLTSDSKSIITKTYEQSGGLSGVIKGVDFSVDAKKVDTWSSLIETSSKYGNVSASIWSTGGTGISEVEKLAPAMLGDLAVIVNKISEYASTFTKETSAITHYLLISSEAFGAVVDKYDPDTFFNIRSLVKNIVLLDVYLNELKEIKEENSKIFDKYYTKDLNQYISLKKDISVLLDQCISQNACMQYSEIIPSYLGINNYILDENLLAFCSYRPVSLSLKDGNSTILEVLANVRIYVEGKIRMYEELVKDSSKIYYLTKSGDVKSTPFRGLKIGNEGKEYSDVFASVSNTQIDFEKILKTDNNVYSLEQGTLQALKDEIESYSYFIETRLQNGIWLRDYLGFANFENCPITREL